MAQEERKKLKTGFTTGAAAAAAVKGALHLLLEGDAPKSVRIDFIGGGHRNIGIHSAKMDGESAIGTVIKDAGDDPDVTHKAEIGAVVSIEKSKTPSLIITGGKGVGRVTKPGLEVSPGEPAINSGPRKMIQAVVNEMVDGLSHPVLVTVEIFVPEGEVLAQKTLNARLGIMGGISILGTTGLVRPMSHDAYIATIQSSVSVAQACHVNRIFLTTGRRSERYAGVSFPGNPPEAFVQIGDFFKMSIEALLNRGFEEVVLAVFFGKALKMAYGIPHTHAAKKDLCMKKLSHWAMEITSDKEVSAGIKTANTAREAYYMLKDIYPEVIQKVGFEMIASANRFSGGDLNVRAVIFDFGGEVCFDSDRFKKDLRKELP